MPYDNEYNRMVADDIMKLNKKYIDHEKITGAGMSGGFLGALAGMILPQIVGAVANKVFGKGMPNDCGCPEDVAECVCGNDDKQDDFKGGSGFASGSFMDTGYDRTIGAGMSAGVKKYKKVKSKMACEGAGRSGGVKKSRKMKGEGIISDLGIPLISNVAGLFGLGSSGAGSSGAGSSGAGSSGAGSSGAGSSGAGLSGGEMKYLGALKKRLEDGKKATKRDEAKLLKMKSEGKLEGGFLPALLGAIATPLLGKLFGKGGSGGGMSGGAELGLPPSIAGEGKKRGRKSKMGKGVSGGALVPVANMKASYMAGQGKSGGKKKAPASATDGRKKRQEIVKKVMAEKGLSMIEASKYVKEHNLY